MVDRVRCAWAILAAALLTSPTMAQQSASPSSDAGQSAPSQSPSAGEPPVVQAPGAGPSGGFSSLGGGSTSGAPFSPGQASVSTVFTPDFSALLAGGNLTAISLNLSETYRSDVIGISSAAAGPGVNTADFLTAPSLKIDLARVFGNLSYYAGGSFGYVDYARHSVLSRSNIALTGGSTVPFGLCQASIQGGYNRGQASLGDIAASEIGGNVRVTPDLIQNANSSFTATCGRTVGLVPTVNASLTYLTNDAGVLQALNALSYSGSSGFALRTIALGVLTATAQYTHTYYPNRASATAAAPESDGFTAYGGGLSYVTPIYLRLQGNASLSYQSLQPQNGLGKTFNGFIYSALANYPIGSNIIASISASRQTGPANSIDALFDVREQYSASATYRLSTLSNLQAGVSDLNINYEDILFPQLTQVTRYKIYRVYVSASRMVGSRLRLGVDLSYRQTDANLPGFSYPDVLVGISASSRF